MAEYLTDEQFLGGGAATGKRLTDEEFLGDQSVAFGSIGRGWNRLQQTGDILLEETGIISPESAAKAIAGHEADIAQYPTSPTYKAGMKEIGEAGKRGWGPLAYAMLTNPSTMLSVVGESVPASGAMLAAGAAGSPLGTAGMMTGAGLSSFATEYASSILDVMQDNKVDVSNAEALEAAFQNPELMHKARERGVKRGVPIAVFDAISMGVAGRIAHVIGATEKTASRAVKIAGQAAEIGAQAAAGGGGEYAGEVAAGQPIDPAAIALEAGAEVVTGLPEIAIGETRAGGETTTPPGPAGAAPAETIIPGVEIIPEDQAPPAPVLQATAPETMVINDPAFIDESGVQQPAGPLHGMTVDVIKRGDNMTEVRLRDRAGTVTRIGNALLVPTTDVAKGAVQEAVGQAPPPPPPEEERVASPRLTETDRSSPIPNDVIDDGKALVEVATGQPSTVTHTELVDGKREVVQTPVADLTAEHRAKTQAVINQILQGVAPSPIAVPGQQAAPPASAAEVPGTAAPTEAPAAVEPPVDTALERATAPTPAPPIEDVSDDAHPRSEDTQSFEEFVAKSKAHLAEREARADAIAEKGGSTRLEHQTREGHRALVGPDMAEPGKFRITRFDKAGPFGHTTFNTLKEAANEALRDGYVPVDQPTAAEPPTQSELKAKIEANRGAAAPEQAPKPETRPIKDDVAITASGRDVPVTYAVIEADDLIASQRDEGGVNPSYPAELQPRDRSRGTSDQQINKIAQNLNPALLDQNPNASDGAPIISEEGVVESGNGRVLAIRRAFSQGLGTAKAYVDYLASKGYPVQGMQRPVLVRVRKGQLATDQRQAFTREANERTTLAMSATERAMADAKALKPETVELYRGGDIADAGNRDFVRSFMQQVVNPNEQAAMVTPEGGLSQEAIRRIQSALLAQAYGDADLVGSLVESTDTNIKAIGGALMDVAGLWAQMRSEAKSDAIDPDVDVTAAVLEAVRLVQRARSEGRPLAEFVAQKDIFSGSTISPEAEAVLRLMFRNTASWTMPAGREKLADALRFYATEARKTTSGVDLLGETAPPATAILATAKARQYGETAVQEKLPSGDRATGKDTGAPSQGRAVKAQPRPKAEGRPSPAPKAPAKAELTPKEAMAAQIKADGEKRAAAAKAKEEAARPKFSKPGADEPPLQRLSPKEKLLKKRIIRKVKTDPKAVAAMEAMAAVPDTSKEEGFNTDPWWDARRFNVGGKKVALEEYLTHLYAVAKGLSTKEINEGIDQHNRKLKETEAKTGVKGTPLDHVEGYTVENNRDVFIVQGPPAAGKSTIANVIARLFKAAISDVDEAKKGIPGYVAPDANGKMTPGMGASAVHTESGKIGTRVSDQLISEGANLVIPTVGDTHAKIEFLRDMLQKKGYKVHLVLMDIREDTAANRMWGRFEGTGRLIDPDYFMDVVFKPPHIFEYAKSKGKFDGYIKIKTDNFLAARVTEITGDVQRLAVGDRFVAGGQIRPGGFGRLGGAGQRAKIRPGAGRIARQQEVAAARAASFKLPAGVRQETATTPSEKITYTTTPEFAAKANAFFRSFRKILNGYGLKGVNLKVWEDILVNQGEGAEFNVNGVYVNDLISLALQIGSKPVASPEDALHHEVMHAMLALAATDSEKAILERKSKKEWITDEIKRSYPEAQWVEEGIAHAYVEWLQGARMDGMISRAFKNFKTFLKGLYQALTAHDIRTAEDVFRQVKSGKTGARTQVGAGIEFSPQASPSTYFNKPMPSEMVDMFEGPREQLVIPGAEKISDKQLAERRAQEKLRPTVAQKSVEALPLFGDEKNQLALFSKPPSGPNDARFSLLAAPHSAQQAQQVSQGFLNRGQPVDRALRMPFEMIGGLDNQNRWSWGKRLSDKMGPSGRQGLGIGGVIGAGIGSAIGGPVGGAIGFAAGGTVGGYILGSKAWPTTGAFGFLGHFAENAKRGLIDGYGLDPEYIETYRKSELGKAAILRETQGILKVLSNAGVGTPEAKVLQAVLTGENVTDADMIKLSVPIRKAIDDMGAEAVSLGLISAESFQRNRASYLHRVYAKNEVDQSTLAGWVSAKMSNRRKKIIGDELKGRGIFMDVAGDRLMQDVESFKSGGRGAPVLGEKFRVVDEVSTVANLTPGAAPKEKTLRRVYLPANEAVPAKYQGANWVDRGTWEVRKQGKTNTLWRDYTKAERDKMGEIVDARYTIAKTFMLMANDLSTGRFFRDVAVKQEWTTSTPPPDGQWKDASEYSRYWEDPSIGWVKVPDTNIQGTGGKKRWGALAGKWVRSEIWRDLNEVNIANTPGVWRTLLTQWKKNKTGRNPVVHMNNVMSNVMFMDLADVRTQDLVAGIKAFFKGDANYQEALDNGAFGGDMISQEIRDQVFKPILDEISKQTTGAKNPFLAKAGIAGIIADKLWTKAKQIDNGMLQAYQAEDQLFRMAAYMRRRSQGESAQVAAQNARDQFLNYDIRAPWVVMMRNSLFPFISYTYRAVPKLAENIMHRPWKVAKYAAVAYAVNALAYLWDDGDDGEDRERAALRDEEQGYTWLGTPRMLRMPWRDQHGLPVFLDIRRWVPAGDIFDTTQGSSALPIPAPLHFGGPLQMAFEFMLNRQAFTGEDITNDLTMDAGDKFAGVADWAWKSWAPASFWTPGSWYWTKISNAIHGATDTAGHPYSLVQAGLSSLGIKVKPVDVENGIMWHFYDFQKVQKALKKEMQGLSRQLDRGLISQSAFDSGAADIMSKFENLGQRVDEFDTRTKKVAR